MNINPFVQLIQQGNTSPQQLVMLLLENQSANNPMLSNLLQLAKSNDGKGIEQVARNMMKERGLDFDTEFNKFKQMYNL
jgi:spore germination protein YaaH